MRTKLLLATLALIAMQSVYAADTKRPLTCPLTQTLKKASDLLTVVSNDGRWSAIIAKTTFGTKLDWSLYTDSFSASDEQDALKIAKEKLESVNYSEGPFRLDNTYWGCEYLNDNEIITIVTPPIPMKTYSLRLP